MPRSPETFSVDRLDDSDSCDQSTYVTVDHFAPAYGPDRGGRISMQLIIGGGRSVWLNVDIDDLHAIQCAAGHGIALLTAEAQLTQPL